MLPRLIDTTTHSTHIMAINTHGMTNTAIIAWKKWLYRDPLDPYEGCFALISLATLHLYHDCTDVNKFQKNKLPIARTYETSSSRWHCIHIMTCFARITTALHCTYYMMSWHRRHPYGHRTGYISHHNPTAPISWLHCTYYISWNKYYCLHNPIQDSYQDLTASISKP